MFGDNSKTGERDNESLAEDRETGQITFASREDIEECRRLHQKFGKTYYFATQRFPSDVRWNVHALYGFVRVPDEWVDNPGTASVDERKRLLAQYRRDLLRGFEGVRPEHPAVRAFCDTITRTGIPIDEPLLFLNAMEMDLQVTRYATYGGLRRYMRGSASAVGNMMCHILAGEVPERMTSAAMALGEAMQLTNFLRDVGEDAARGRIYLPQEDLESFAVREEDILNAKLTPCFVDLMKFEIERARALYRLADDGIPLLPDEVRKAVRLARILYSRILDRVEARHYDVFRGRAKTSRLEKLTTAAAVWWSS